MLPFLLGTRSSCSIHFSSFHQLKCSMKDHLAMLAAAVTGGFAITELDGLMNSHLVVSRRAYTSGDP